MKKRLLSIISLVIAVTIALATVAKAEDDFKHFGVRFRGIFVMPDDRFDGRLSPLRPSVSNNYIPELDLEYFFTRNISAEVIAGVTRHDIKLGNGAAAGLNNGIVGSTYLLPPSITIKYHPIAGAKVSPYIGAGIELTFPFNYEMNGVKDFKVYQSVGWAAQAGVDIKLKDNLYFNLDYKYLNVDTQARIAGVKYDVDLNPHLFGVGVGYRF
jgi:outer membrane protein